MNKIKVFIIMFNLLTWPKKMAEFLSDTGCKVILLDNNSTYPPLLKWYEKCPYKVYHFDQNFGELVFWKKKLGEKYRDRYYIITDPDLGLETIPKDYIEVLFKALNNHSDIIKSGFSYELEDLPENDFTKKVKEWENQFWEGSTDSLGFFYQSALDTTFAIYDRERANLEELCIIERNDKFLSSSRSPRPYTAKHLPWYSTPDTLTEEEKYYHLSIGDHGFWYRLFKKGFDKKNNENDN